MDPLLETRHVLVEPIDGFVYESERVTRELYAVVRLPDRQAHFVFYLAHVVFTDLHLGRCRLTGALDFPEGPQRDCAAHTDAPCQGHTRRDRLIRIRAV